MKNFKFIIVFNLIFLLTSCVTNDMRNNNFVSVVPQKTPADLVGNWTGSMSAWLVTFRIQNNGEGIYCYSGSTSNGLQKIKYSTNQLLIQDGTKFDIQSIQENNLNLKAPYFGVSAHSLFKDDKLNEASVFCAEQL